MNNSCHNRKSYRIGFAPAEPRRVGVPPAESRRVRRQTSTDAWTPVLLPRGRHRHVVAGIRTGDTWWSGPARRTSIAGRQHTRFLSNRRLRFARGSCFDANDTLYSRPFFTLSNRLYRMSLRPTVTEQSARDPSGAGPFFAIFVFPVSNVKRMAHVRTCHGRPTTRIGPKI